MSYLIYTFVFIIAMVAYIFDDENMLRLSTYLLLISNFVIGCKDYKKNFLFLSFNFTFFTFLLGTDFASLFAISQELKENHIQNFSPNIRLHIYLLLFISLFSLFIGYYTSKNKNNTSFIKFDVNSNYVVKIRKLSKALMYFFSVFAVLQELEKAIFVQTVGYLDYYLTYASHLPLFVIKLASFYFTCFYIYIATLPPQKECNKALWLYFIINAISLGYGQRNGIVLCVILIIFYITLRENNKIYPDEVWLTKKKVIIFASVSPFIIFALYAYNYIRSDMSVEGYSALTDSFLAFFHQQGGSVKIIGFEKEFSDANIFPNNFKYMFGTLVDLFQQNYLFKLFNVYPSYAPKSYELAVYGHNFSETITYLYRPDLYYAGHGLGTCYIGEAHHDFGIMGVILINFIYGKIFAVLKGHTINSHWKLFAIIIIITSIMYAPRGFALEFLNAFFSVSVFGIAIILHFLSKGRR